MRRMAELTWAAAAARLLIWGVCVLASANRAHAQCSARDVLQRQLVLKAAPVVPTRMGPVTSVSDVAEWKTISIGTFPDRFALLTALSTVGCGVGNSAAEALAPTCVYAQRYQNGGNTSDSDRGRSGLQG